MDEGHVFALGDCLLCERPFTFDPERVPSFPWPPPDGPREPICYGCLSAVNAERRARGLDPLVPLRGAYFEED